MFRFTIRDVLWLMVVVGMGVGWFTEHSRMQSELAEMSMLRSKEQRLDKLLRASDEKRIAILQKALTDAGLEVPREPTIQDVLDAYDREHPATK